LEELKKRFGQIVVGLKLFERKFRMVSEEICFAHCFAHGNKKGVTFM
jgi:hypothetical protein